MRFLTPIAATVAAVCIIILLFAGAFMAQSAALDVLFALVGIAAACVLFVIPARLR